MRNYRELARRLSQLEGAQGERLVVVCCPLSVIDARVTGLETVAVGDRRQRWERSPGESLEALRARAASEVGGGGFGFFSLVEVSDQPRVIEQGGSR